MVTEKPKAMRKLFVCQISVAILACLFLAQLYLDYSKMEFLPTSKHAQYKAVLKPEFGVIEQEDKKEGKIF